MTTWTQRLGNDGTRLWSDFQNEMETLVDQLMGGASSVRGGVLAPRTNISESDTDYELSMELPGIEPEQVNVEVHEGRLTISGEKIIHQTQEGRKYHRLERATGKFQRVFEFPSQVDLDRIDAAFHQGVLTIRVPKSEKALPRKVTIKTVK